MDFFDSAEFCSRLDDIHANLLKNNSEYALAHARNGDMMVNIDSIIDSEREITISSGDCSDFKEFFDNEMLAEGIMQQEAYKQGYLDCVSLLKQLGVLASI